MRFFQVCFVTADLNFVTADVSFCSRSPKSHKMRKSRRFAKITKYKISSRASPLGTTRHFGNVLRRRRWRRRRQATAGSRTRQEMSCRCPHVPGGQCGKPPRQRTEHQRAAAAKASREYYHCKKTNDPSRSNGPRRQSVGRYDTTGVIYIHTSLHLYVCVRDGKPAPATDRMTRRVCVCVYVHTHTHARTRAHTHIHTHIYT